MSLLREIEGDLSVAGGDVTTVLRKARILAARLNNKGFDEWVHSELNGYAKEKTVLPSYRILNVHAKAHLVFGYQQWREAPIMVSLIPERFRHWATTAYLFDSISQYASLVDSSDKDAILRSDWPQEVAVKYGGSGYVRAQCLGAGQEITKASLVAVVETVRNKLLDFVLEIEAENPDAGEALPHSQPVPPEKVQQLVNNYFGPVGNIAQHAQDFTQSAEIGIQVQDLNRLVTDLSEHLSELNLEKRQRLMAEAQLDTLKAQLSSEPNPVIVQQAGRTLRNITEGAIAGLLATAVKPTIWQTVQGLLNLFPH